MSTNDNSQKKLSVKLEFLRHLETAKAHERAGKPSSGFKVKTLEADIKLHDKGQNVESRLDIWGEWLAY